MLEKHISPREPTSRTTLRIRSSFQEPVRPRHTYAPGSSHAIHLDVDSQLSKFPDFSAWRAAGRPSLSSDPSTYRHLASLGTPPPDFPLLDIGLFRNPTPAYLSAIKKRGSRAIRTPPKVLDTPSPPSSPQPAMTPDARAARLLRVSQDMTPTFDTHFQGLNKDLQPLKVSPNYKAQCNFDCTDPFADSYHNSGGILGELLELQRSDMADRTYKLKVPSPPRGNIPFGPQQPAEEDTPSVWDNGEFEDSASHITYDTSGRVTLYPESEFTSGIFGPAQRAAAAAEAPSFDSIAESNSASEWSSFSAGKVLDAIRGPAATPSAVAEAQPARSQASSPSVSKWSSFAISKVMAAIRPTAAPSMVPEPTAAGSSPSVAKEPAALSSGSQNWVVVGSSDSAPSDVSSWSSFDAAKVLSSIRPTAAVPSAQAQPSIVSASSPRSVAQASSIPSPGSANWVAIASSTSSRSVSSHRASRFRPATLSPGSDNWIAYPSTSSASAAREASIPSPGSANWVAYPSTGSIPSSATPSVASDVTQSSVPSFVFPHVCAVAGHTSGLDVTDSTPAVPEESFETSHCSASSHSASQWSSFDVAKVLRAIRAPATPSVVSDDTQSFLSSFVFPHVCAVAGHTSGLDVTDSTPVIHSFSSAAAPSEPSSSFIQVPESTPSPEASPIPVRPARVLLSPIPEESTIPTEVSPSAMMCPPLKSTYSDSAFKAHLKSLNSDLAHFMLKAIEEEEEADLPAVPSPVPTRPLKPVSDSEFKAHLASLNGPLANAMMLAMSEDTSAPIAIQPPPFRRVDRVKAPEAESAPLPTARRVVRIKVPAKSKPESAPVPPVRRVVRIHVPAKPKAQPEAKPATRSRDRKHAKAAKSASVSLCDSPLSVVSTSTTQQLPSIPGAWPEDSATVPEVPSWTTTLATVAAVALGGLAAWWLA